MRKDRHRRCSIFEKFEQAFHALFKRFSFLEIRTIREKMSFKQGQSKNPITYFIDKALLRVLGLAAVRILLYARPLD